MPHVHYEALCKKDFRSGMDQFYDYIVKALTLASVEKMYIAMLLKKDIKAVNLQHMTI